MTFPPRSRARVSLGQKIRGVPLEPNATRAPAVEFEPHGASFDVPLSHMASRKRPFRVHWNAAGRRVCPRATSFRGTESDSIAALSDRLTLAEARTKRTSAFLIFTSPERIRQGEPVVL